MVATILTSILPVCLLVVLGAALCRSGFLPDVFFTQMNRLGFWLLLPSLLFSILAKAPATAGVDGLRVGLLLCACSVVVTLAGWLVSCALRLPDGSARALMQAAMRGNLAYTGFPVLLYTFGAHSAAAAVAVLALAPSIPFYNFWAVLILTRAGEGNRRDQQLRALIAVLRNPLIIGCGLGLLLLKSGLHLPAGILNAVEALGQAALPCALLALGAGLTPDKLRVSFRPALAATVLKLVAMPVLGYAGARVLGFSGDTLLIALLYLASPCAVTSYVMADQMGADKELAGAAIVLSTLLCLPVMMLILLLFGAHG
ncbi:MAG: AEC family transporter [bacterium]